MSIKDIPFIIPNFNQLTYLRNLINQIRFYCPGNEIHIIDNSSTFKPLLDYYQYLDKSTWGIHIYRFGENDFIGNLSYQLEIMNPDYYVISDPDISIHPATPPNFLEIFKAAIDNYGFHHAGFGLITEDIPAWNPKAGWIQGDEKALLNKEAIIEHDGKSYLGHKAALDTTMCLYKRDNGGWQAPMSGEAWGNCIRLFKSFHLPWYLDANRLNPEMENYYNTCLRRDAAKPSAGRTHYVPEKNNP